MAASAFGKSGPVPARKGHFLLESGLHTDIWLELESLFLDPADLLPQIEALAALIEPYQVSAVCGPLLGGAFLAQAVATRLGVRFYFAERLPSDAEAGLFQAQYRLPASQHHSASKERFAIVDDAIGAGSLVRATFTELTRLGAETSVIAAFRARAITEPAGCAQSPGDGYRAGQAHARDDGQDDRTHACQTWRAGSPRRPMNRWA